MNKINRYIIITLLALFVFLIVACAGDYRKEPSGGPIDREAPVIGTIFPPQGSLNQPQDLKVKIAFNEYIRYSSTTNSVTIFPNTIAKKSEIIWGEKDLEIHFKELAKDQTVMVILSSAITDMRNNPLKDNFVYTFSTGNSLDSSIFAGVVEGAIVQNQLHEIKDKNIKISLYNIGSQNDSTILPTTFDYQFSPNKERLFKINGLNKVEYLPLAFVDQNRHGKFDFKDNVWYSTTTNSLNFQATDSIYKRLVLGERDVSLPFLKEITALSKDLLALKFSTKIMSSNLKIDSLIIDAKRYQTKLLTSKSLTDLFYLQTDSLVLGKEAMLYLSPFSDLYQNISRVEAQVRRFVLSDKIEPIKQGLTKTLVSSIAVDDTLNLSFKHHNLSQIEIYFLNEKDSLLKLKPILEFNHSPFTIGVSPSENQISVGPVRCLVKNGQDTLYYNKLAITEPLGFGYLSGKIKTSQPKNCHIILKSLDRDEQKMFLVNSDSYKLKLRPGKYLVATYLDLNSDGQYSPGLSPTQKYAEPAIFHQDSLQIRKNWEVTDFDFNFSERE